MADLYEDIYKYLDDYGTESVSYLDGLEEMIGFVRAHTGIDKDKAEVIIDAFIKEIRNAMLRGDTVCLNGFGELSCCGKTILKENRKVKVKVYPRFKTCKKLHKSINNGNSK